MVLTWSRIGASLCLIAVGAWALADVVPGRGAPAAGSVVVRPAVDDAEAVGRVVKWASEGAGRTIPAPARLERTAFAGLPGGRPVPANTAKSAGHARATKGGGKVSYVGSRAGSGASRRSYGANAFTRALSRPTMKRMFVSHRFTGSGARRAGRIGR